MISDKRWRRKVRIFKDNVHIRYKLGVIDTLCDHVATNRVASGAIWLTSSRDLLFQDLLFTAVMEEDCPIALLKLIVEFTTVNLTTQVRQPTADMVLYTVDCLLFSNNHIAAAMRMKREEYDDHDKMRNRKLH